ncbi:hypothetical protein EEB11_18660 [Pseudotabrizicola sediminis]|uniref:Uncharacterized protein n=1 Tax=Pseudotabrizicola sediminis TaxID=2486418 RepID=A0ABY2KJW1_9RHOB|nr:hypothetical protein [Pseudotabrizicola sediminis]TGD41401.1 hypothetical protein EEB11_18660 [Pseudotabrizicola sediminis]
MTNIIPQHTAPSPRDIAAGVGNAARQEICGLLAMLDAARLTKIAGAMGEAARRKLFSDDEPAAHRVTVFANELMDGQVSTDALRASLWLNVKQGLGLPGLYLLSARGLEEEAAAIAVRASEILAPAMTSAQQQKADADLSIIGRTGRKLLRSAKGAHRQARAAVTFPDVVAHELMAMMDGLAEAESRGDLDPEVAAAIRKGQHAISASVLAGGGWAAMATAVGSTGFAPYIAAAQLSAMIPFVTGPTLTSFLFVAINPVTVVAGSAALGYWAVSGRASAAREVAAARVAILLAVRGQGAEQGTATLLNAFRELHRMSDQDLNHLDAKQRKAVRLQAGTIVTSLSGNIPTAASAAPGLWGARIVVDHATDRQDTALVAGLTAGDMLFHVAAVDPAVLAAADFSRVTEFDTPIDLAVHVAAFASQGARIALRGYSAEQLVMAQLIEDGHDVMLADGAATPGYDLIVDGIPVQVKCGTSISLLHDHFAKYPDIPVIADNGLAAQAQDSGEPWAPMVTTTSGFDLDHVQSLVDQSLQAAVGLAEVPVPVYAMLIGGARAAHKAWTGQIPIEDLPAWLVIDLTIRGGLAGAGQAGGAILGLLVLGPAGALILGPVAGVAALLSTGRAHDLLDRGIRSEWRTEVLETARDLHKALLKAVERQVTALTLRLERLRSVNDALPHQLFAWLEARMADDLIAAIETRDQMPSPSSLRAAMELLVSASATDMVDPNVLRARYRLARCLAAKPSTTGAAKELGGKIGEAIRERVGRASQ